MQLWKQEASAAGCQRLPFAQPDARLCMSTASGSRKPVFPAQAAGAELSEGAEVRRTEPLSWKLPSSAHASLPAT